jgi:hypothetical protein
MLFEIKTLPLSPCIITLIFLLFRLSASIITCLHAPQGGVGSFILKSEVFAFIAIVCGGSSGKLAEA